jgi:hypothetical protein
MPSKHRKKLQRQRIWNEINKESLKQRARQSYILHRETIISNVKKRKRTDQTGAKKAALRARKRWANDSNYRLVHTERVKRRQATDPTYRDKHKQSAMKYLLKERAYRDINRDNVKKRLAEDVDLSGRNREGVKKPLVKKRHPKRNAVRACSRQDFTVADVSGFTFISSRHFVGGNGPTADHPDPIPANFCYEQVGACTTPYSLHRKAKAGLFVWLVGRSTL